jgi:hypothetical protein
MEFFYVLIDSNCVFHWDDRGVLSLGTFRSDSQVSLIFCDYLNVSVSQVL